MVVIYKIVDPRNIDVVRYVGKTIMGIEKRMRAHLHCARINRKTPLYLWMSKVIKEGVIPLIIEIEEVSEIDWADREIYWIKYFREKNGDKILNISLGGESNLGVSPSEETRQKISLSNKGKVSFWKGKKLSEEHKKNIGLGGVGKIRTEETKKNISNSLKGRKLDDDSRMKLSEAHSWQMKGVLKICKISGNIIEEYESISRAIKENNIEHLKSNLISACKGRIKTCAGYVWRYK
jgi:group I intron endonuclease